MSIPLAAFNLVGQGNSCEVIIDNPVVTFEGDLYINCEYRKKVKLRKLYKGSVYYKMEMEGKSSEDLDVDLIVSGRSLTAHGNLLQSELRPE